MLDQIEITELEQDILKEIINIGLAKTADSLAIIAREKVMLNVPEIKVIEPTMLPKLVLQNTHQEAIIISDLKGEISGKTIIVFNKEQAEKLAQICIGNKHEFTGNYLAMKRSLLLELGNILTGALVTQFGNIFKVYIYGSPPIYMSAGQRKDLAENDNDFKHMVLTIMTRFINSGKEVELPLIIVLDILSIQKLVAVIRQQKNVNDLLLA